MQAFPLKGENGNYAYFPNEKDTVINADRFAISYLGVNIDSKKKVICTRINPDAIKINKEKLDLIIRASKLLKHENLVETNDIILNGADIVLIREFVDSYSLKNLIYNKKLKKHNYDSFFLKIIIQALVALEFFHTNGLTHCNINPDNILVLHHYHGTPNFDDPAVKIKGLDLLKMSNSPMPYSWVEMKDCELLYASPEQVLKQHEVIGPRSDIYSMGIILYETVAKKHWLTDETNRIFVERLQYSEPIKNKDNIEEYMFSIIQKACQKTKFTKSLRHYSDDDKREIVKIGMNERFHSAKDFGLALIKYMEINNLK